MGGEHSQDPTRSVSSGSTRPASAETRRGDDSQALGEIGRRLQARVEELERDHAEAEEQASRYRHLVTHARDLLWEIGRPHGRITYLNPAAEQAFGIPPGEWQGREFLEYVAPEHRNRLRELFQSAVTDQGDSAQIHFQIKSASGDILELEAHAMVVRDDQGELKAVHGVARDVTHEKAEAEALRASEAHYRMLTERAQDTIAEIDETGRFVYMSPNVRERLGYEPEELIGTSSFDLLHPEDVSKIADAFQNLTRTGVSKRPVYRLRHRSGEWRWIEGTGNTFETPAGTQHTVIVSRDITDRMRVEEALRRSETRYRTLVENAQDLVYEVDEDGVVLYVSPNLREVLGYDPETHVGADVLEHVHPADLNPTRDVLRNMMRLRGIARTELRYQHADGRWRWLEVRGRAFRGPDGHPRGVAIVADITSRKLAEEDARVAIQQLRTVVANAPVALIAVDREGIITLCEGRGLEGSGLDPERILGRSVFEFMQGQPSILKALRRALRGIDVSRIVPFGNRVFEARYRPMRADDGSITGLIAVATDVTERVRAEEEHKRLESRMQLAQKLEGLGVLAGGIAHDFNNLLTSILGYAGLALKDLPAGSPTREQVGRIEEAARRAADLTSQMLAYAGLGEAKIEAIDLRQLVERMVHLLEVSVSRRGALRCELETDLPPIRADSGQITQVVLNLITNAAEAIEGKDGVITVRTGVMEADREYLSHTYLHDEIPEGEYVYLEVADNGCGMDEETHSRIFDPFFSTKFTGRGLGLASVLGIVRAHLGTITVDTELGKGSSFRLLLPKTASAVKKPPKGSEPPDSWRASGAILVVDDEQDVREMLSTLLPRFGLDVLLAAQGNEATALLRKHSEEVTAVLLDLTMPEMGGEEALEEIRRIRPDVPVILMSGYTEHYASTRVQSADLTDFLQKPFTNEELRDVLHRVLPRSVVSA
jgi:PAS domain S-box-containing protein